MGILRSAKSGDIGNTSPGNCEALFRKQRSENILLLILKGGSIFQTQAPHLKVRKTAFRI